MCIRDRASTIIVHATNTKNPTHIAGKGLSKRSWGNRFPDCVALPNELEREFGKEPDSELEREPDTERGNVRGSVSDIAKRTREQRITAHLTQATQSRYAAQSFEN